MAPPPSGASADFVATNIGSGLGLSADLAPTSTQWERAFVVGPDTAVLVGRALDQAVAIRTTDKGKSWVALKTDGGQWQSWSVASDGSTVLVSGQRKKAKAPPGRQPPIESARAWFAPADATALSEPTQFFPNDTTLKDVEAMEPLGAVAIHSSLAGLVVAQRRQPLIAFVAPAGKDPPAPVSTARLTIVTSPYGRPAHLVSLRGSAVEVRPWPEPGTAVDPGSPIPGLPANPRVREQLDRGPGCDAGAWSFQLVSPTPDRSVMVGVSGEGQAFAFQVPATQTTRFGCSTHAVAIETFDAEKKEPQLVRCTLDGKCATPKSLPFQIWPEQHKRTIHSTTTRAGVAAIMAARSGTRWGVYLAQSTDQGATFELARIVGEGKADTGYYEPGVLLGFPDRVLLLLSAEQTGTSKRRWYVLASDDGGSNWGPP